jgi:hypothetical protein
MTMLIPDPSALLSSWKDIAKYTGKGVRTVQRWEREGLPVRRPVGFSSKTTILLYTAVSTRERSGVPSSTLRDAIRTAHELTSIHRSLSDQINRSVRLLTESCQLLPTRRP